MSKNDLSKKMLQNVVCTVCGALMLALLSYIYLILFFGLTLFFLPGLLCKKYFAVNIELFYKHIFMVLSFVNCRVSRIAHINKSDKLFSTWLKINYRAFFSNAY